MAGGADTGQGQRGGQRRGARPRSGQRQGHAQRRHHPQSCRPRGAGEQEVGQGAGGHAAGSRERLDHAHQRRQAQGQHTAVGQQRSPAAGDRIQVCRRAAGPQLRRSQPSASQQGAGEQGAGEHQGRGVEEAAGRRAQPPAAGQGAVLHRARCGGRGADAEAVRALQRVGVDGGHRAPVDHVRAANQRGTRREGHAPGVHGSHRGHRAAAGGIEEPRVAEAPVQRLRERQHHAPGRVGQPLPRRRLGSGQRAVAQRGCGGHDQHGQHRDHRRPEHSDARTTGARLARRAHGRRRARRAAGAAS